MPAAPKQRLDDLLVARGLAGSRSRAKALVLAGKVRCGTQRLDKPGRPLPADSDLSVEQPPRFVSRSGEKLEGFLDRFALDVRGCHVLDVGASTGGFTDCCLQRGAAWATCLDVGRAQLHHRLRGDPRVTNLERVNARHLKPGDLPETTYPLIVIDVSFISLTKVLPPVWPFLSPAGSLVALVKPQFEATREEVTAGRGVIRDHEVRERVLREVRGFALSRLDQAECIGTMDATVSGTDGNREFLLGLRKSRGEGQPPAE